MSSAARIFQYVWPYRGKVLLSALFAMLVALLWSLNLSTTFPIVKVLMEGETLSGYVNKGIAAAALDIEEREVRITYITSELDKLDEHDQSQRAKDRRAELLAELNKQQQKLSASSRSALVNNWLKSYVMPWLPDDQFDMLAVILGFVMIATVLKSVFLVIQEVLVGNVVELTVMQIRKDCFRHVLKLDYQTLSHAGTSDLMARFTYDLTLMANGLTLLGGKVVREPLKAVGCVVFAFFVNWRLTLLSMLVVPLVAVVFYRIGRKLKVASKRMMESMSRLYKTLEETFDSLKVVIAFHGGRRHRARFHRENKEYLAKAMKLVHFDAITSPSTEIMGLFAVFIALLPGAYLVLRETKSIWGINLAAAPMDMAQLSLLYVLLAGTLDPIRKLSTIYTKLKRATAAADRVFALMEQKSLVKDPEQPQPAVRHRREVHFDNVTFTYHRGDDLSARPPVLKDVDLRVRAGEVVVVVGENGSGKSTLVNLLPRYYDPEHGAVRIDGVDIRELRLRDLRAQISVVTQETLLFDESILENIRYGRPGASVEQVYEAARQAHVTPFVEALPEGFETRVGEKGGRFSGGQRQRIALARAMLRDPAILILDEATSAIDAQSEKLIHAAIREFARGRTVFIITHSVGPSILDFADRIAVMDQGHLVGIGPHEALVETCPVYASLYRAQVRQRSAESSATAEPGTPEPASPSSTGSDPDILPMPQDRPISPIKRRPAPPTGSDG